MYFLAPAATNFLHLCNSSYRNFGLFPNMLRLECWVEAAQCQQLLTASQGDLITCTRAATLPTLLQVSRVLVTKHTILLYSFTDPSDIHAGNSQPILPLTAESKTVPRHFRSFPYFTHAIYQTSWRQYVTANPTLTYISITSTNYTYRHF